MTVLITGGGGFVGLATAEAFLEKGWQVVIYDRQPCQESIRSYFQALSGEACFVTGDVLDREKLEETCREHDVSHIIHGAAITPDTQREISDARTVVSVNCGGTATVLDIASRLGVSMVIHLSTGAVYGRGQWEEKELFEDLSELQPETLYEVTKVASEQIIKRHMALTNLQVLRLRLGDVFGAWEYFSGVRDVPSAPFQATRLALTGTRAWLPRPGLKCWVYSRDVGAAVFAFATAPHLRHELYHLSSSYRWSIADWCERLSRAYPGFGYELTERGDLVNIDFRPDHSPLNIERMSGDTGYVPRFDLDRAFADYMDWISRFSTLVSAP